MDRQSVRECAMGWDRIRLETRPARGVTRRPRLVWWRARGSPCTAAPAGVPAEVTFTKDIAPDSAAQLPELPSARRRRADVARHLRRSAAVGARDQAAHRHRPARRRDAAVVHREEHRHPALQGRSVAQRRGDREDREVGRQRRAARQSGRHAAAAQVRRRRAPGRIGTPDLDRHDARTSLVKGNAPDWWGEIASVADRPHRGSLRRGARDQGSQRRAEGRHRPRDGRRPLRVPPHDLEHARCSSRRRAERDRSTCVDDDSTGWPVHEVGRNADFFDPRAGRLLQGRLEHRLRLGAPALERPRHEGAPRDRLQVPSRRATSRRYARARSRPRQRRRHRHQADGSRTSSCTPTPCCRSTPRSRRSSRTCTRRARGCASRRSGASTSRR